MLSQVSFDMHQSSISSSCLNSIHTPIVGFFHYLILFHCNSDTLLLMKKMEKLADVHNPTYKASWMVRLICLFLLSLLILFFISNNFSIFMLSLKRKIIIASKSYTMFLLSETTTLAIPSLVSIVGRGFK